MSELDLSTNTMSENDCIQLVSSLIINSPLKCFSEPQLKNQIEQVLSENNVNFQRDTHLSDTDVVDFMIPHQDGAIALVVITNSSKSTVLRQISKHLKSSAVTSAFVVGTPYWVLNLSQTLSDKKVFCYQVLTA